MEKLVDKGIKSRVPVNPNGTYFSFDNYNTANPSALQVPRGTSIQEHFNTLQIIDDVNVSYGRWGQASYLEPITCD